MADPSMERRRHKRHSVDYRAAVTEADRTDPIPCRALNVSDGGILLAVGLGQAPAVSGQVDVKLLIPRSTPNTYMLEEFSSPARVVRHEPLDDGVRIGLALQFKRISELGIEV